jgi:bifunctional UDP-N-acetylglucosamine pyrophosphorylase / glucosamine-1-phosphate N-acetyltransferase
MSEIKTSDVVEKIKNLSTKLEEPVNELAIILAAGHGKRLKSEKSKMLHEILGVPTVERVYNACKNGIENVNTIIVVGIKVLDVAGYLGKKEKNIYAYQEVQLGTGHAVQVALEGLQNIPGEAIVYVLPGDMGLIDAETLEQFRNEFIKSKADMIVLTGMYEGKPEENYYGRIVRAKDENRNVIQIMENKDIHALPDGKSYKVSFNGKEYSFTKEELINNNEYNSGVFAFKYKKLAQTIGELRRENVQKEIYLTDLISIFNEKGFSVAAMVVEKNYVVMGFNTQEVLKEMNEIAKKISN